VTTAPLLSVGLPVYNGAEHLAKALDAVLGQDLEDFEVIVCDNASTDTTAEIARDYAARDARIQYHRNQRNLGLAGNFNKAFELAGGRYFKWWAHDDWHPSNLLSRTTAVLEADPSAVLCATGVAIMDDEGEVFEEWRPEVDLLTPPAHVRFHRLLWTLGETHPLFSVMRADALAKTPRYRPFVGGDRVLLAQLVLMGGFAGVPDLLHYYRQARMRPGARKDPSKPSQAEILDPANKGKLPSRTWRLCYEHLRLVAAAPTGAREKAAMAGDVVGRFAVRDARLLAAEAYHSGRILASRAVARTGPA
jgi:glycosyltransferase involved in cell wall biosynthesis